MQIEVRLSKRFMFSPATIEWLSSSAKDVIQDKRSTFLGNYVTIARRCFRPPIHLIPNV